MCVGGGGVWAFVYHKWPDQIVPTVNSVFSHDGHFGLGGSGVGTRPWCWGRGGGGLLGVANPVANPAANREGGGYHYQKKNILIQTGPLLHACCVHVQWQ